MSDDHPKPGEVWCYNGGHDERRYARPPAPPMYFVILKTTALRAGWPSEGYYIETLDEYGRINVYGWNGPGSWYKWGKMND